MRATRSSCDLRGFRAYASRDTTKIYKLKSNISPVAIYLHIPFCPTKCGYCDFNSYAMEGEIMRRTTDAILREVERSPWRGAPAKTIFFGGGTPTFIPKEQLGELLDAVRVVHPPVDRCEITSEANPGTVDSSKFYFMRQKGFNRISLGAQSFFDDDLIILGRIHRSGHIERAVKAAKEAGFSNINVDLMFALPGQNAKRWKINLDRAIALETEHLSLYGLTIEPNTPFYKKQGRGELTLPEEDEQVRMYELAIESAAAAGFRQYEISNFAKPNRECRHNLCYWHNEFYAGYGPGAVGFMPDSQGRARRYTNLKHPERYSLASEQAGPMWYEEETLEERELRTERLMLGLRLNEGLDFSSLDLNLKKIDELVSAGLLSQRENRIRLTSRGQSLFSEITVALL